MEVFTILSAYYNSTNSDYFHNALVDGIVCNIMLKKLSNNDFLLVAGQFKAKKLGKVYQKHCVI